MRIDTHISRHSWRGQLRIMAAVALGAVAVYFGLTRYVVLVGQVVGTSMTPTLEPGERYAINRLAYRWQAPARGDIVAVRLPSESDLIVKRIVALPGEQVAVRGGLVLVNGMVLQEPYLKPGTLTAAMRMGNAARKVADDCFFLLGDNRAASADSRMDGAVPRAWIVGRVSMGL